MLTAEDFASHRGDAVTPISTNYRGLDLVELPPNGQGLTALVMLNILENFDLKALDPLGPERFHLVLEAARLGFAVRDTHLADAGHMRIAVADLLDKGFAKTLAAKIDLKKRVRLPSYADAGRQHRLSHGGRPRPHGGVVHQLAVFAFRRRNLHREDRHPADQSRRLLHLEPGHPNVFGPDKRPMHTIIPGMAMRDGRCDMSFGVMGAHYQPMGHVQIVTNMLDYGMDVQQAIDAPRFFFEGEQTVVETGTPAATVEGLKARGHDVVFADTAVGRRADHQDRLGSRRADRRLRAAQGRLRARLLSDYPKRVSAAVVR